MPRVTGDFPRVEGRAGWVSARARNALRRTVLMGAVGATMFVSSLVALVLVPRQVNRAVRVLTPRPEERADTARMIAALLRARRDQFAAESTLAAKRVAAHRPRPVVVDTMPAELVARRDSITEQVAALSRLVERAEAAPLPASYRALGESPQLAGDPRVRVLLDSLAELERERTAFDAVGGVDPIFVALTARATTVGRSIQAIAEERRSQLRQSAAALRPPPPPPAPVSTAALDTIAWIPVVDAARQQTALEMQRLAFARRHNAELDLRLAKARELANVSAPPVALLVAALVLGAAMGFGTALAAELLRPRVADKWEAERIGGSRVLAVIRPSEPTPERARRRADAEAPPLITIASESYRLLYLHFTATGSALPLVTVTGDEPSIVATVASNLAAASAYEARSTLIVDGDLRACAVAGVLRVPPEPGLAGIVTGVVDWARSLVTAVVGRDRTLDVIPAGAVMAAPPSPAMAESMRRDLTRLARRYDLAVIVAPADLPEQGDQSILPSPDVMLCARVAHTTLARLRERSDALRRAGMRLRGLVLWDADLPQVPTRDEIAAGSGLPTWTETRQAVTTGK
jgi:Mrp family chromosome partitioning ATPase